MTGPGLVLDVEAERERLHEVCRVHARALPAQALFAVLAACDELVDPLVPPTLIATAPLEDAEPTVLLRESRERLVALGQTGPPGQALACGRAARLLSDALASLPPSS